MAYYIITYKVDQEVITDAETSITHGFHTLEACKEYFKTLETLDEQLNQFRYRMIVQNVLEPVEQSIN